MPSTVEELASNRVKLTVEIPFADLKPALDKAYRQIAQQVTVPGFRKGKVPTAIIDQRFGRGTVIQEAINEVLPQKLGEAIDEHKVVPLGEPEIEITKLEDGNVVEFTAELDRRPEFTIADPSAIKVEVEAVKPTDEDVEERIQTLRERFATYDEVERAAQDGDVVFVDLAGSRDGEKLDDATAEGVQFKIGNKAMLEGLDEAVIGLKAGESKSFTSTLVGGPLKGQEADIEVTLKKVTVQKLPELDDDFAQMVSEFDTVEEMRADLAEGVARMASFEQASDARDKVLEEIVAGTEIDIPQSLVDAETVARKQSIEQQLAQAGMSLQDYLDEVEEGRPADEFWTEVEDRTLTALKAQLILDQFGEENDVQIDQQDLTEYLMRRAQQSGTSPEQEVQHMMEHNHMQEWMGEIRRNKSLALLVAEASVKDTEGNPVDLTILAPARPEAPVADEAEEADEAEATEVETTEAVEAPAEPVKPAKKGGKKAKAESADSPESPESPESADSAE